MTERRQFPVDDRDHTRRIGIENQVYDIRQKLWEEYGVSVPNHIVEGWALAGVRAEGRFVDMVWLFAWPHLLEDHKVNTPGVLLVDDSMGKSVAYVRTMRSTIEPA